MGVGLVLWLRNGPIALPFVALGVGVGSGSFALLLATASNSEPQSNGTIKRIVLVFMLSCFTRSQPDIASVPEQDENEEAVRNVEKITESDPVNGEDLIGSEETKRKLREAKKRLETPPATGRN